MSASDLKYFLLVILMAATSVSFRQPQKPTTGFWAMKGTLITHYFDEKTDSLSGPEIYELQDEDGLPIWFCRHIYKDVCISGVCKMIRLWLFWDGAGNYYGIQVPEDEPLTKSDHTVFEVADYQKLETILQDSTSILKNLKQEDLIIIPDSINPYEVDGYTAATQPALEDVIVKDAVYTCHTLWHTIYGNVQDTIHNILNSRITEQYLDKMFSSQKVEYVFWAIETLKKHSDYHHLFYPKVIYYISSDSFVLSKKALDYFQPPFLSDPGLQVQLTEAMTCFDMSIKYEVLWKLIGIGQVSDTTVLKLLTLFQDKKIGVGAYNLILRLVTVEHIKKNNQIAALMQSFAKDENAYIRNLTVRKLNEGLNESFD